MNQSSILFDVTIELKIEDDKGHIKKARETYLVEAVSVTDAEATVVNHFKNLTMEYTVKSVKQSRTVDFISNRKP